jgi:hypothetical protein
MARWWWSTGAGYAVKRKDDLELFRRHDVGMTE